MANSKRVKVEADLKNNILYLHASGQLKKEHMASMYTDIRFCVADLQPGFHVIADYSRCNIWYISTLPTLRKIIDFLLQRNVGRVVRIINKNDLIFRQFLNLTNSFKNYRPTYVSTMEEAEKLIIDQDILVQRKGIRYSLHNQRVTVITDQGEGTGDIVDISTSGLGVANASTPIKLYDIVKLNFTFQASGTLTEPYDLKAVVVRTDDSFFAAEFINIDEETKGKLNERLAIEAEKPLPA